MRRGDRKENRSHKRIYSALFVLGTVVILGFLGLYISKLSMISSGLYPVEESLVQAGYKKTSDGFEKKQSNVTITIKWNKEKKQFDKNHYLISTQQEAKLLSSQYVDKESLEVLTNGKFSNTFGFVHYTENKKKNWLKDSPRLVAHAGGTIREKEYNTFYTNSLEALQQNYGLGHRLFEMDFYLTSDRKLAAVHDWH